MPYSITKIDTLLKDSFDKVLVITVPRFINRQEKVKKRLEGISFDFFYGSDKNGLTDDFIRQQYHYDKKNTLAPGYYFKPLNTGEIACSLSHRMVYQAMIDNNWQKILILEDDVVPDYEQLGSLAACLKELPPDWELLYLGYLKNEKITTGKRMQQFWYTVVAIAGFSKIPLKMVRNQLPRHFSPHLWRAGLHDCTHAYAISLSAAKKLLTAQTPVTYRADNLLTAGVLKGEIKAFASKVFLFNQEVFTDKTHQSYIREKWANQ
jgi:glycosyl transferase family 25